jgi:WD40 repeat protein
VKIKSHRSCYADLKGCTSLKEPHKLLIQLLYPYWQFGHKGVVSAFAVLPDGNLAVASEETIKLWDVHNGRCLKTLAVQSLITALAVLPDGHLASASGDSTAILRWDIMGSGRCFGSPIRYGGGVNTLAVLPDGRLATGSGGGTIKLWDISNGQCLATLVEHQEGVSALTGLSDGRLASGSPDTTIKLWDTSNGQFLVALIGHENRITALTGLPDGNLASGSKDGTIKLWDTRSGQCLVTLADQRLEINALTVLSDGRLASGFSDGTIKFWTLPCPLKKFTSPLAGEPNTLTPLPSNRLSFHRPVSSLQQFKQLVKPLLTMHYPFNIVEHEEIVQISLSTKTLSKEEAIRLLETLQTHITSCFKHWELTFNIAGHTLIVLGPASRRTALLNLLKEIGLGNDLLKPDQDADDLREKKREHEY